MEFTYNPSSPKAKEKEECQVQEQNELHRVRVHLEVCSETLTNCFPKDRVKKRRDNIKTLIVPLCLKT